MGRRRREKQMPIVFDIEIGHGLMTDIFTNDGQAKAIIAVTNTSSTELSVTDRNKKDLRGYAVQSGETFCFSVPDTVGQVKVSVMGGMGRGKAKIQVIRGG
jgi:hypothetical protein